MHTKQASDAMAQAHGMAQTRLATNASLSADPDASRRAFLALCGGAGAALGCLADGALASGGQRHEYPRTQLVDEQGRPLRCEQLAPNTEYIFHYPFPATPCFLIDTGRALAARVPLKTRDGATYEWPGGAGPKRSIVAFSGICAHKLSHPSRVVSFIGYRDRPVGIVNGKREIEQRAGVIQCCSEQSVYDPARGAAVVSGPAPQPLATIELDCSDGTIHAVAVVGGEMFAPFFERFGERLALEMRSTRYADPVGPTTVVTLGRDYSRNRRECS